MKSCNLEGLRLCDESELCGRPILRQNHMRYRSQAEWSSALFNSLHHFMQDLPLDPKRAASRLHFPTIIHSKFFLLVCHLCLRIDWTTGRKLNKQWTLSFRLNKDTYLTTFMQWRHILMGCQRVSRLSLSASVCLGFLYKKTPGRRCLKASNVR